MNLYAEPFLSGWECAELRAAFERNLDKCTEYDFSGQPVLREHQFADAVRPIIGKCVGEAIRVALRQSHYLPMLCLDTVILTRMGPGGWHEPHADNCRLESGEWVPNHTSQRTHSAMMYLSSWGFQAGDFVGGELHFPDCGVMVRPRAGMLVAFPADRHHVHEVRKVIAGQRYSLAIWLADRKD